VVPIQVGVLEAAVREEAEREGRGLNVKVVIDVFDVKILQQLSVLTSRISFTAMSIDTEFNRLEPKLHDGGEGDTMHLVFLPLQQPPVALVMILVR